MTLQELIIKNENGELPKKFTDEELIEIWKSEQSGSCSACPMKPFESPKIQEPVITSNEYTGHGLDYPPVMLKYARDFSNCNVDSDGKNVLSEDDTDVFVGQFGEFSKCGDTVKIFVKINDGVVVRATWLATGCYGSIASASYFCEKAVSLSVKDINVSDLRKQMYETLTPPKIKEHCVSYPLMAFQNALEKYEENQ